MGTQRVPTLIWDHTELGRRSSDERYHIVRDGFSARLFDVDWNLIAECPSLREAQLLAERIDRKTPRKMEMK